MTDHYYSKNPEVAHDERSVIFEVLDQKIQCTTDAGVFSRDGLDMGTRVLIEALPPLHGRVLDLGCGWGAVGCALGRAYPEIDLVLTDINERAVELARRNLADNRVSGALTVQGDGFQSIDGKFDFIVFNPPIRTGKQVFYPLLQQAKEYLTDVGALYIVIRKQQGAESAEKYLQTLYPTVRRVAREKGYWVLLSTREVSN